MSSSALPTQIGRYRVIAKLGQGGMARVFLTLAPGPAGFHKLLVVKQLREELSDDPDFLTMFLDEARLAARLNHPNVVHTYEVGGEEDSYFIAMDYLEGQPLNRLLAKAGRDVFPLDVHLRIISDALTGLHYAHELQDFDGSPLHVVHRDVSPANVFVTYDGQVKLVDFGIAKAAGSTGVTREGTVKGKIAYIAPEQARAKATDRRADIFSVGVMLWEALAGRRIPKGQDDAITLNNRVKGREPKIPEVAPQTPQALVHICERAMALKADDRFQTADELRIAIDDYLESTGRRIGPREIGELNSQLFQDAREQIRTKIERQVALQRDAEESGGQDVPVLDMQPLTALASTSSVAPPDARSIEAELDSTTVPKAAAEEPSGPQPPAAEAVTQAEVAEEAAEGTGQTAARLTASTSVRDERGGPSMGMVLGGGLAALLLVGGALFLRGGGESSDTSPAEPATGSPPTSRGASAPTASATAAVDEAEGELVSVVVKATPKDATIAIDGARAESNPFEAKVERDGSLHRIRVEAPGYQVEERVVSFDDDVSLEVELAPRSGAARPSGGMGTPAGATTTTATPDAPPPATDPKKPPPRTARPIDEKDPYR